MKQVRKRIEYRIPWLNVIRCFGIMVGIVLLFAGLAGVLFTGIQMDMPKLVALSLAVLIVFGATFFRKIQFWTNVIYQPIQEWIYTNVRCSECAETFVKCERTMERPKSFASFICYCANCRKAELFETGTFDRILAYEPIREVESLYEKKYHGEVYKLPGKVSAAFLGVHFFSGAALVFVLAILPAMIYVHLFGPSEEAATRFRSSPDYTFISMLLLWDVIYWRSAWLRAFLTYPIRRWIRDNVTCPQCGGHIGKCNVKLPDSFFDFFKYSNHYCLTCQKCNNQAHMHIGGFDSLLRFA